MIFCKDNNKIPFKVCFVSKNLKYLILSAIYGVSERVTAVVVIDFHRCNTFRLQVRQLVETRLFQKGQPLRIDGKGSIGIKSGLRPYGVEIEFVGVKRKVHNVEVGGSMLWTILCARKDAAYFVCYLK